LGEGRAEKHGGSGSSILLYAFSLELGRSKLVKLIACAAANPQNGRRVERDV